MSKLYRRKREVVDIGCESTVDFSRTRNTLCIFFEIDTKNPMRFFGNGSDRFNCLVVDCVRVDNPVKLRCASRPHHTVTNPTQPLANHRSDKAPVIPDRHEAIVSSRKIFLCYEIRFASLIPMELDPMFRDARASCFTAHEAARAFSSANPTRIIEQAELPHVGRIIVRDGDWFLSETQLVPSR